VRASYSANIAHLVNPEGKGTLYNLGCYPVSLLQLVMQTVCGHDMFRDRLTQGVGNLSTSDANVIEAAASVRFGNGVLANLHSTDCYGNSHEFSVSGDNGVLRFETNPWLPVAGPNTISWSPFGGQREDIVVVSDHDAFVHQIQMVERHVAAGDTEPARPSPRLADSIEIMEMLTEWEALCRESTTT